MTRKKNTTRKLPGKQAVNDVVGTTYHQELHQLKDTEINQAALNILQWLLWRCSMNLITDLTGITRATLYRWLDPKRKLETINTRDAAWFILICETSPRVQLLLSRPPGKNPHLAKRMLDQEVPQ